MDTTIVPVQTDGLNRNLRRYDIQVLNALIRKAYDEMIAERQQMMIAERQQIFLSRDCSFKTIEKVVRHDTGEIWHCAESINATEGSKWNENYLRSMKVAQSTRRN